MTAATNRVEVGRAGTEAIPALSGGGLAADENVKRGWSMMWNGDGYLVECTAATGLKSAGIAYEDCDNTGGDDGDKTIRLYVGVVDRINGTGADELDNGDIGAIVYGSDNQTACKTDGTGTRSQLGIFYGINPENSKARVLVGELAVAMAASQDPLPTLAATTNGDGASLIGIEDAATNFAATNVEAALAEIVADLAATTATNGASRIGLQDAGSFTAAATVEAALAELYQDVKSVQAQLNLPFGSFFDADGDPLAKFVDGASTIPGFNLADSEAFGIRWNNHATPGVILASIPMPQDLDDTAAVVLHILASKTGATLGDAVTFLVTAFFQTVGAAHDADANLGGTTGAMTGDAAAKTSQEVTLSFAHGDVPASPSVLTMTIKPTDGTLGTDDVLISGAWLEYKRKLLTA